MKVYYLIIRGNETCSKLFRIIPGFWVVKEAAHQGVEILFFRHFSLSSFDQDSSNPNAKIRWHSPEDVMNANVAFVFDFIRYDSK